MSHDKLKQKPIDPEIVKPEGTHPDEVIHVPKGSSKVRFLMTFLLVVMVLTTFSVSTQVLDVFGGRTGVTASYMTWTTPGGQPKQVSLKAFGENKRSIAMVLPWVFPSRERDVSDEHTAAFIALDESAAEAGIHITDGEMAKWIEENFKTTSNYVDYVGSFHVSRLEFEATLRRMMRVDRYRELLAQGLSIPDPKAIETQWKGRHQEYMYDYVTLPVATLIDEARAQAPKGDELKAWFDALSEPEKAVYKSKPEVSAELVGFSLEGTFAGDAILAKFPRPADTDADKEARQYRDDFGYVRFPRTPTQESRDFAQPYEQIKEKALLEAPIYNALMDWVASLQKRESAGETIDLSAEAALLGLSYRKQADLHNHDSWKDLGISFVGRITTETLFAPERASGKLLGAIQVDEKAFVFGRVLEMRAERMPDFAEIEARVSTAWSDKKAKELALARLEKVRDALGTRPDPSDAAAPPFLPDADEAKFADAVKAAGLTVQRRDWRERTTTAPTDETPAESYIRMNTALTTQRENTVGKPELSKDGTVAYLVRIGGIRDPDVANMKVEDLTLAERQQSYQEQMMFVRSKVGTKEFLQARYGMDLNSWHTDRPKAN